MMNSYVDSNIKIELKENDHKDSLENEMQETLRARHARCIA